ncbi:MAG: PhoH family protein [Pirellulales bacterium]|nr:PhoH family protein [Pirellulales bacterium]
MIEAAIPVGSSDEFVQLLGTSDQHLRQIRNSIQADISARNGRIHIRGEEQAVFQATEILERLKSVLSREGVLLPEQVAQIIQQVKASDGVSEVIPLDVVAGGKQVRPRTAGQSRYIDAIRQNDMVFCIGPAGTGKTYLAVAAAVEALRQDRVRKLVLVRPAVEAGESLGFLPGDLQAKINPYLRPLLDALRELMDYEMIKRYMEDDVIEVVPLAYMRGRTLNEAFVIMDEGQNTTIGQMKMFLTRMGERSKVVVTGDTSQTDLPAHTKSGLTDAIIRLKRIQGISNICLTGADIVRHRLVQEIVRAYEFQPKKKKN